MASILDWSASSQLPNGIAQIYSVASSSVPFACAFCDPFEQEHSNYNVIWRCLVVRKEIVLEGQDTVCLHQHMLSVTVTAVMMELSAEQNNTSAS